MHIYVKQLNDKVCFHANHDTRFKNASLTFHYLMPYSEELSSAMALLPAILKRGTQNYPTLEAIARQLEALFGSDIIHFVRKRGTLLEIAFRLEAIDDAYLLGQEAIWADAIKLLLEIIYSPRLLNDDFPIDILEQEKRALIDSIVDIYNAKDSYALMRAAETVFPHTLFSSKLKGSVDSVSRLTKEELLLAYQYFRKQSILHIYYTGNKQSRSVLKLLRVIPARHTGALVTPAPYANTIAPQSPVEAEEIVKAEQSHVVVCYQMPIRQLRAQRNGVMSIYNSILGHSPTSKLYQEVREKSGLCYSCSLITHGLFGVFTVEAGVQPGREAEARARIMEQFDAMRLGLFTDSALAVAKESIKNATRSISSSPQQLENHYMSCLLSGTPYELSVIRADVDSVTREDVVQAAEHLKYAGTFILRGEVTGDVSNQED